MKKRIFVENEEKFVKKHNQSYLLDQKATAKKYDNAIILPAIKAEENLLNGKFSGGVCDTDFNFIAGLTRSDHEINFSCERSYKVQKENINYIDEEIIFGGVLFSHFGHVFLESLSRLWYVLKNPKNNKKIAFIIYSEVPDWVYSFFELLKIDLDRIKIITEPTRFKRVIVPDETIHAHYRYRKEYLDIFNAIRKNVKPQKNDKIYLTRTQLNDKNDINEEFYENFYRKRGYVIIAPEKYSIKEQISLISGAKEIVCSLGTLSHLALFCKDRTKIVMLNRVKSELITPQVIIDQARNLNYTIIDATLELLPTNQARGCYCFYPTKYFKEYLDYNKIQYKPTELEVNEEKIVYEYLLAWTKHYSNVSPYETIANKDAFEFINCLSKSLYDTKLKKGEFNTKRNKLLTKKEWIDKYKDLSDKYDKLNNRYNKIINSKLWALTKPLRYILRKIKKIRR